MRSLLSLDNDVLHEICGFLPRSDAIKVAVTAKRLYPIVIPYVLAYASIATDYEYFNEAIDFVLANDPCLHRPRSDFARNLVVISVSPDDIASQYHHYAPKLTSLLSVTCHYLRKLILHNVEEYAIHYPSLLEALGSMTRLSSLELHDSGLTAIKTMPQLLKPLASTLRGLCIAFHSTSLIDILDYKLLLAALSAFPLLDDICLNCTIFAGFLESPDTALPRFPPMPNVRKLELIACMPNLVPHCPNVKMLLLDKCLIQAITTRYKWPTLDNLIIQGAIGLECVSGSGFLEDIERLHIASRHVIASCDLESILPLMELDLTKGMRGLDISLVVMHWTPESWNYVLDGQKYLWTILGQCTHLRALNLAVDVNDSIEHGALANLLVERLAQLKLVYLNVSLYRVLLATKDVLDERARIRIVRDMLPRALAKAIPTLRVLVVGKCKSEEAYLEPTSAETASDDPTSPDRLGDAAVTALHELRRLNADKSVRDRRSWWIERDVEGAVEMTEIWAETAEKARTLIEKKDFRKLDGTNTHTGALDVALPGSRSSSFWQRADVRGVGVGVGLIRSPPPGPSYSHKPQWDEAEDSDGSGSTKPVEVLVSPREKPATKTQPPVKVRWIVHEDDYWQAEVPEKLKKALKKAKTMNFSLCYGISDEDDSGHIWSLECLACSKHLFLNMSKSEPNLILRNFHRHLAMLHPTPAPHQKRAAATPSPSRRQGGLMTPPASANVRRTRPSVERSTPPSRSASPVDRAQRAGAVDALSWFCEENWLNEAEEAQLREAGIVEESKMQAFGRASRRDARTQLLADLKEAGMSLAARLLVDAGLVARARAAGAS
ncbi:uncharacterized protein BXZ73DRAFT_99597 [Epithele typhae]|uniref:uncharacterized protein n=1 Tax=Epithele typhae TaxID=378194 RepID=UPI00200789AD|nr:uncharacterized protein BXZ73DRAFT_99597 [Epithele typhae]KAH9939394.1 hypothetical protein BXZ73DRAFT_99597 [Epithele typhae]